LIYELCLSAKDWRLKKKITTKIEELKVGDWHGFPAAVFPAIDVSKFEHSVLLIL